MNEDLFDEAEKRFQAVQAGEPISTVINENMGRKIELHAGNFVEILIPNTVNIELLDTYLKGSAYNSVRYRNAIWSKRYTALIEATHGNSRDRENNNLVLDVTLIVQPEDEAFPPNVMMIRIHQEQVVKKGVDIVSNWNDLILEASAKCNEYLEKLRAEQEKKEQERLKEELEKKKAEEEKAKVFIDKIKEFAEFFHPDCWSFDELDSGNDYIVSSDYKYRLTIHFPEFTITNSRKNSHFIKDMYIAIHFNHEFVIYPSLIGRRGTLTLEEWQSTYGHSHMNTGNNGWSNMCLGDSGTPIAHALQETSLLRKFDENGIKKVLALLHGYIIWESLEGTPYIQMTNVSRKNTSLPTASLLSINRAYASLTRFILEDDIQKNINLKLSTINSFNRFIFDRNEIEKILSNPNITPSDLMVYKSTDGTYVNLGINIERTQRDILSINQTNSTNWTTKQLIKWKGQYLTPKVVLNYSDSNNLVKVPTPNLTEGVFRMLEEEINNYNLKNKKYELD